MRPVLAIVLAIYGSIGQPPVADAAPRGSQVWPPSDLLTAEESSAFERWQSYQAMPAECRNPTDISAERGCMDRRVFAPLAAKQRAKYKVHIRPATIAGVNVEVITPVEGISPVNLKRVLINLHGGAFIYGARFNGQVESIPIASVGRIKVISVDYRMAPEHAFPAASEDVTAVYRSLLNEYGPGSIGIYGCSSGAVLTAQSVAWIQKEKLPPPGAIGMFCGAATFWTEGDTGASARAAMIDSKRPDLDKFKLFMRAKFNPYFRSANLNDPLVFPITSKETLARFPPSLLISATRDFALSSVVHTHSRLVKLGVKAELHVWEGLDHSFFSDPDIPQSEEMYERTTRFFDENLRDTDVSQ